MDKPSFQGGVNIAVKIPPASYERTLAFYRDVLGMALEQVAPGASTIAQSHRCRFGPNTLWLDMVPGMERVETWLELRTDDLPAARAHLTEHGVALEDHLEPLPAGFAGHWIRSPAGTVHLVCEPR